jgi:hypothetical protein
MRWWLLAGVTAAGLLTGAGKAEKGTGARPQAATHWLTDYAEARAAARLSDRPILVVFR